MVFKRFFVPILVFSVFFVLASGASMQEMRAQTLTVYTYDSFASDWGLGPDVQKAFEEECSCKLRLVSTGDAVSLLNRLKLEGENHQADIVLGLDTNLAVEAVRTGLFAPHGLDLESLNVKTPIVWENSYLMPYDYGWHAFIYNSETLPAPPKSFEDLLRLKPRLIIQDPRSSSPGMGLMLWVQQVYGDNSIQYWERLRPLIVTVTPGWSEAYSLFLEGEADMVLSYTTSPAYHQIVENDTRYRAAMFKEGHYMQVELMGMTARAQRSGKLMALAQDFMAFMVSQRVQEILLTRQWMYPVNASVPLPEGFRTLPLPEENLLFPSTVVYQQNQQWIQNWKTALGR